jgi:two-component system KDP operon response regulator KdpE
VTRILVVVRALRINLRARQYEVDVAPDGAAALRQAAGCGASWRTTRPGPGT